MSGAHVRCYAAIVHGSHGNLRFFWRGLSSCACVALRRSVTSPSVFARSCVQKRQTAMLFAVADRVTVYRRIVHLIGRVRHVTVYRYRHTRDPRICSYCGVRSENGKFHVLCVENSSAARKVKRIGDNLGAPRRCGDTRRCERA